MKGKRRQADIVRQLSDRQLILNLYVTQFLIIAAAFVLGLMWFDDWSSFFELFRWDKREIAWLGGGLAAFVILIDVMLMNMLSEEQYDDGGINERMFSILPVWHIPIVTLLIAFAEEMLFRGVLQTHVGLIAASVIFAVLHVRYLRKIVLFTVTVTVSFLLGVMFYCTGNLFVPIFAHFLIDVILGLSIRIKHCMKEKEKDVVEQKKDLNFDSEGSVDEGTSPLPPRKEYHRRKKKKNPFLLARLLLFTFLALVAAALVYSIYLF